MSEPPTVATANRLARRIDRAVERGDRAVFMRLYSQMIDIASGQAWRQRADIQGAGGHGVGHYRGGYGTPPCDGMMPRRPASAGWRTMTAV